MHSPTPPYQTLPARHHSTRWPRRVAIVVALALILPSAISEANQKQGRGKPHHPYLAIDNEGPVVVIRNARTMPGNDEQRLAGPGGHHWLPWRPTIRLDLILPLHTLPDRPTAPRADRRP